MCILLKLDYAKFGVSKLFFPKLSKKNLWGVEPPPPPPLVKEGLIVHVCLILSAFLISFPELFLTTGHY